VTRRNLHLHLLVCLDALITEKSVTRAAQRVGVGQPSMSNALARLRVLTNDALLVRTSRGMEATPRALELVGAVRRGLLALDEIFADTGPFAPADAVGRITVAAADFVGMLLFPKVMKSLHEQAPGLEIDLRLPDPVHADQWLADGECDLAVGYFPVLSPDLRVSTLFVDSLSCLVGTSHPDIGSTLSPQQYFLARHVMFGSPFSAPSTLETAIDTNLSRSGVHRKLGMRVSSVMLSPYVVAGTTLLATVPERLARHYATFLPVKVLPVPAGVTEIAISMVWHERTHRVGLHNWFRELMRQTVEELLLTG
jgi:DNA-binding transcriptional LysR family regulator